MAKVTKKVIKKRRDKKNIPNGQVHIRATFNNTIVTVTDTEGNPPPSPLSPLPRLLQRQQWSTVLSRLKYMSEAPEQDVSPQSAHSRLSVFRLQ